MEEAKVKRKKTRTPHEARKAGMVQGFGGPKSSSVRKSFPQPGGPREVGNRHSVHFGGGKRKKRVSASYLNSKKEIKSFDRAMSGEKGKCFV